MNSVPKERPILFSAPMVRAILDGRKTQTRRIVKPQPNVNESYSHQYPPDGPRVSYGYSCWYPDQMDNRARHYGSLHHFINGFPKDFCPHGQPGDRLWVRESFQWAADGELVVGEFFKECPERAGYRGQKCVYAADGVRVNADHPEWGKCRWLPSIHMPRGASRITLEITDVRVQRLQEVTEPDAQAEGAEPWKFGCEQKMTTGEYGHALPYRGGFACLWDEINSNRATWFANPWVWALTFKAVQP